MRGLGVAAVVLSLVGSVACRPGAPLSQPEADVAQAPRAIFLVTIDTLRADHVHHHGYPRATSPFLDRIAGSSVVFTRAYAASSTTIASHASLFTSLFPQQHQMIRNGEELDPSVVTVAQTLSEAGWQSGGFTTVNFMESLDRGFDRFRVADRYHGAATVVDWTLEWLNRIDTDRPVFVWVHLFDVHEWYKPENLDLDAVERARGLAPYGEDLRDFIVAEHGADTSIFGDDEAFIDAINAYDGQLLSVDEQLERLYRSVTDLGLNRGAVWIVTSDHGEGLGSHSFKGHGAEIYEEQIRVPLLVHAPAGSLAARRIGAVVRHVDIVPTILELVSHEGLDQVFAPRGISLAEVLRTVGRPLPALSAYAQRREADEMRLSRGWIPGDVHCLVTDRYKYIRRTEGRDQLFALDDDPLEAADLLGRGLPVGLEMRQRLEAMFDEMSEQGRMLQRSDINPEYIEQLKALGYL